jgi:hypothetical protein
MEGTYLQAIMMLVGYAANQKDQAQRQQLLQQAMDAYKNLDLPQLEKIAAQVVPPSEMEKAKADPEAVAAQYQSLGSLDDVINGNGLAAEDRASINRIGNEVDRAGRGSRAALRTQMQANGTAGGGMDVAAQLAQGEQASTNLNQAGLDEKQLALRNRLSAISQKGSLASNMRSASFGEAATKAQAADLVNRYNAAARTGADMYNAQLPEQQYENQLQKLQGQTGAGAPLANFYNEQGQSAAQFAGGFGRALSEGSAGSGASQQDYNQALSEYLRKKGGGTTDASGSNPDEWEMPFSYGS